MKLNHYISKNYKNIYFKDMKKSTYIVKKGLIYSLEQKLKMKIKKLEDMKAFHKGTELSTS